MKYELEPQPAGAMEVLNGESIEKDFTFELTNEKDKDGHTLEGKCFWVRFSGAEAKFFVPQKGDNKDLIIFEPGLPGDSVAWFEDTHIRALLDNGYAVLVMRHLGTRTDTEKTDALIHCPERVAKSASLETNNIGEVKEYNLAAIAEEPTLAIKAVGSHFDTITLIGHSSGVLYNAYAIGRIEPALRSKISNFVGLSGYLGGQEERTKNLPDLKNYYEYCKQFINMGDAEENSRLTQQISAEIYKHKIPDHIMVVQVNSPQDEYIPISWAKEFQDFLGRGLNITDKTQFETDFHDLKNLQPATLLRLLKIRQPKSRHTATVSKR